MIVSRTFLILFLILLSVSVSAEGRTAEKIYQTYCTMCHMAGVANAPKTHDEEAWKARNKTVEELVASSKKGLNAMPPMGMCNDCSDGEFKAAIEYMMKKK